MKRSEALVQLKIKLTGKPMDELWLSHIMDAIEDIGMLPPARAIEDLSKNRTFHLYSVANVWEPEDE